MDGRKILLDCGWDDRMDTQALEPLRRIAPLVDAVLISHPDTAHGIEEARKISSRQAKRRKDF